ncbi:hypothetical protein ILUMI_26843 [Ignelater luminosus]|uniref:E3 ubiquitin-protein ligase APD1-4 middle domain-containing protein n=1 Tax=Ignelater luminosus TaxID=2038154 RepID=A0A8K0C5V4_IGNLU|nr:hypothetical protein ILUMI_26843 [Ignelater luminosus]
MVQHFINLEEFPLQQHSSYRKRPTSFKGPLRVVKLCIFGIALPAIFISLPLYLRYHVYAMQLYPFAVSDMRLLDRSISTVWCQKQTVKLNTTFNAFVLPHHPQVAPDRKPLSMERTLYLDDDMKEYWGFYLLKGSTVTISTCVRWPGASLIVIRGHKHLHECAYIGDDSSEELEELLELVKEGIYVNTNDTSLSDAFPNAPRIMKRHRSDVRFHHPLHNGSATNHSISEEEENDDVSDITDPRLIKSLLEMLSTKSTKKDSGRHHKHNNSKNVNNTALTVNETNSQSQDYSVENATMVESEKLQNVSSSEELFQEITNKLDALGDRQHRVLQKLNDRITKQSDNDNKQSQNDQTARRKREITIATAIEEHFNADDEKRDKAIEEGFTADGIAEHRGTINETTLNDRSRSEFWSSFSSSEEALLNCEGLILNLPLTPHSKCSADRYEEDLKDASLANTVTYLVPRNGYYFFVFNSENEIQTNYIRVHFNLNKTVYDVSHSTSSCANKTDSCALDLSFFSEDKMVMELPPLVNESRWNEEFIVVSECEPRTLIYMCCVLAVPVLVVLFAFQ